MTLIDDNELGKMVQYEVPLLHTVIQHYERLGYSHANAEQLAVHRYSRELRAAFDEGVPSDIERRLLEQELENERLFMTIRGGRDE